MNGRIELLHRTAYHYARPVRLGPQWLRLRPLPHPRWAEPTYRLTVDPVPVGMHWLLDAAGNAVARLALPGPLTRLLIEVSLQMDAAPRNPFDFMLDTSATQWPFVYDEPDRALLAPFILSAAPGPLLLALRAGTEPSRDTVGLVLSLGTRVRDQVAYIVRMEPGVWSPERTLAEGRGSCRDSAWLLVQLLRLHGIAARFVSGYLVQIADEVAGGELHAWAEAYLPGAGWVGIDATSGLLTSEGHIALAAAPDPAGTAPLQGTVEPGEVRLETSMIVERLPA